MTQVILILLLVFCGVLSSPSQTRSVRRAMAVTIDDLPYVNALHGEYLPNARRATEDILRTLKSHRAAAVGFVNEIALHAGGTGEIEARTELLTQWVDAGMTLGNHTYSHADFNALTVEQFQREIVKGEVITQKLMDSRKPYRAYFRHPMTRTGDTKEKKETIETFLAERGYSVAPHTIENSDFMFNVPYTRARRAMDEPMAKHLRETYLDYTLAATEFAERVAPQIFGRDIPQTLLIHANDITADSLDEMLKRFEARGYRFITLDEAMSDPAYQTKDTMVATNGPTWLWRWMKSLGMDVDFKDDPELPRWVRDLYTQR
jgi:peptidoglycan/xylan/chitin deacetylase (PgdA/CDA1 family)